VLGLGKVFGEQILVVHLDPCRNQFLALLLLPDARFLGRLQLGTFLGLERNLVVHVQLCAAAHSFDLWDVAWVVLAVMVVTEGVLVGWFSSKPSSLGQLDRIRVRSEHLVHMRDTRFQGL